MYEWFCVNDYCDYLQHNFIDTFTAEVRYIRLSLGLSLSLSHPLTLHPPPPPLPRCWVSGTPRWVPGARALPTS